MLEESEGQKKEPGDSDPLAGKWYAPITDELEKIETDTAALLEKLFTGEDKGEKSIVLNPDKMPKWAVNCLANSIRADGDYTGFVTLEEIGALHLGKIFGTKWALYAGMEVSHRIWKVLNPKQTAEIEQKLGAGSVARMVAYTGEFAATLTPRFRELKRKVSKLAEENGMKTELDFIVGFKRGTDYWEKVRQRIRKARNKREADRQKQMNVYYFAITLAPIIDEHKAELSWPAIAEMCNEFFDHKVAFDEDAVKKILQRAGLKGVGKAGRPVASHENTEE